jgi:V/A-type H+-transporting ATPase subunit I
MQRVALVAPADRLRAMLVEVADAGTVEIDRPDRAPGMTTEAPAGRLINSLRPDPYPSPRLSPGEPDLEGLVAAGRLDLVAGEAQVEDVADAAVTQGEVTALAGWVAAVERPLLADRLAGVGAAAVPLRPPMGVDPPTQLRVGGGVRQSISPLVRTYGTVPYADLDPTLLAGLAYVLMFGVMFGDVGHGILLVAAAMVLRSGRISRLVSFRKLWPFVFGAGLTAMVTGLLYGEFFGPTGVVPVLWLSPLDEAVTMLGAALGMGAVLLGAAYVVGSVNRYREGGWPRALSAPSGIAGVALFAGLGVVVLGAVTGAGWLVIGGAVAMVAGVILAYVGFLATAGGGAAGVTQATVELFDTVLRLGTNIVSFSRLAAFGLAHAALATIVWDGTRNVADRGGLLVVVAVALFLVGNAAAFALEALVAGVQALRLEYYELFSRVFASEGRPFRPWQIPVDRSVEPVGAPSATTTPGGTP